MTLPESSRNRRPGGSVGGKSGVNKNPRRFLELTPEQWAALDAEAARRQLEGPGAWAKVVRAWVETLTVLR